MLLRPVLGIDNIIFISILLDKQAKAQQEMARKIGLFMTMFMRIGLLFILSRIVGLTGPFLPYLVNQDQAVMVAAGLVSVGLMLLFASGIARFVADHPVIQALVSAFLVLVGAVLVVEGFGYPVSKSFVYFALAFSLSVEMLNIWMRKCSAEPVHLHDAARAAEADKKQPQKTRELKSSWC